MGNPNVCTNNMKLLRYVNCKHSCDGKTLQNKLDECTCFSIFMCVSDFIKLHEYNVTTVCTPIVNRSTIFLQNILEGLLIEFSAGGLLLETVL